MQDSAQSGIIRAEQHRIRMKRILYFLAITLVAAACSKAYDRFYAPMDAKYAAEMDGEADPMAGESYDTIKENDFVKTSVEPVSTFSFRPSSRSRGRRSYISRSDRGK